MINTYKTITTAFLVIGPSMACEEQGLYYEFFYLEQTGERTVVQPIPHTKKEIVSTIKLLYCTSPFLPSIVLSIIYQCENHPLTANCTRLVFSEIAV